MFSYTVRPRTDLTANNMRVTRCLARADNDGPGSGNLKGNGMCKGLDVFSIDSYRDDPAAEVAATKGPMSNLIPHLHPPNKLEPKGQSIWVVPGIFW
jgi:hypothetical protein